MEHTPVAVIFSVVACASAMLANGVFLGCRIRSENFLAKFRRHLHLVTCPSKLLGFGRLPVVIAHLVRASSLIVLCLIALGELFIRGAKQRQPLPKEVSLIDLDAMSASQFLDPVLLFLHVIKDLACSMPLLNPPERLRRNSNK